MYSIKENYSHYIILQCNKPKVEIKNESFLNWIILKLRNLNLYDYLSRFSLQNKKPNKKSNKKLLKINKKIYKK